MTVLGKAFEEGEPEQLNAGPKALNGNWIGSFRGLKREGVLIAMFKIEGIRNN